MESKPIHYLKYLHGTQYSPFETLDQAVACHSNISGFHAIAAMALNRVIGRGMKIPWYIAEDFQWFKKITLNHTIVMGRKTFESIGKPLPQRRTVVVSRQKQQIPGVEIIDDVHQLKLPAPSNKIFVCGGAQLYAALLPYCTTLFLTVVKHEYEGDVYMPPFEPLFTEVSLIWERPQFKIVHYHNSNVLPWQC